MVVRVRLQPKIEMFRSSADIASVGTASYNGKKEQERETEAKNYGGISNSKVKVANVLGRESDH